MNLNPKVIDLYWRDAVSSFAEAYNAGYRGIIHKATEGHTFSDKAYAGRRSQALDEGFLWGGYHYLRAAGGKRGMIDQARHFIEAARPTGSTLLAADHEDETVHLADLIDFLTEVAAEAGRKPDIYSGFLIKEQLTTATKDQRDFIASHRLWLSHYSANPKWPALWQAPFLIQFTGDGVGPTPHTAPGMAANIDINAFDGSDADLVAQWVAAA